MQNQYKKLDHELSIYSELDDEEETIIEGLLNKNGVMAIYGASKAGKTFFALQLGLSVALGINFLNKFKTRKDNTLFINTELTEKTLRKRLRKMVTTIKPKDSYNFFYESLRDNITSIDFDIAQLKNIIINKYKNKDIALVIIDPIYTFLEDEKDGAQFRKLIEAVNSIRISLNCAIVLVHHRAKSSNNYDIVDRGSGSNYLGRWADTIFDLSNAKKTTAKEKIVNVQFEGRYLQTSPNEVKIILENGIFSEYENTYGDCINDINYY